MPENENRMSPQRELTITQRAMLEAESNASMAAQIAEAEKEDIQQGNKHIKQRFSDMFGNSSSLSPKPSSNI